MAKSKPRAIDLFCGAGGSSWGAKSAGAEIVAGFDMWETAKDVYCNNFPQAKFYCDNLDNISPSKVKKEIGKIDLILASPECTNHSVAKGNKPRCEKSRSTALYVLKFAKTFLPRWIVVENVVGMRSWEKFEKFITDITVLGYKTRSVVLNSADFGVPQARRRLFILCDREKKPSAVKILRRKPKTAC